MELIIGVASQFIGGLMLWFFTENNRKNNDMGRAPVIIINGPVIFNRRHSRRGRRNSEDDEGAGLLVIFVAILVMTVIAYMYVKYRAVIQTCIQVSLLLNVGAGLVLLGIGFYWWHKYGDTLVLQLFAYVLMLFVALCATWYWIENPYHLPEQLSEVAGKLLLIDFHANGWMQKLFETFFQNPQAMFLLSIQMVSSIALLSASIVILYFQGKGLWGLYGDDLMEYNFRAMALPFWLNVISISFIGIYELSFLLLNAWSLH